MNISIIYHQCHYCEKKQVVSGVVGSMIFNQGWELVTIHPYYWEACCPECYDKYEQINNGENTMKTVSKEIKEVIKELKTIKELSYDQVKFLFEKNNNDKVLIMVSVVITLINLVILTWNIWR